ncbi:MAG: DNA polymerase I [Gemmatimonadales bacterium]|nr:MAG: DNA polymerase I [Gemmatimonadales bacterium]
MAPDPDRTERPRLFLIDAYALIYRSHFAFVNRPLTNARGENTSAAWGVANFLLRIRDEHEPDYLAMVFDAGMSDREVLYPEYKATREKMPEDLEASLPRIRELVAAFRDPVVELDGFEADDVIGTLARKAEGAGLETVIVSGDKDFYQLVGPGVRLLNPGRGGPSGVSEEWVDQENAHERLGVPPERVVDYLALIGDSSDNVPGAPGIGPKTAVKLLERYGSLDQVLAARDEISGKRARTSLQENHEQVELSRKLVTIRRDLDVPLDLDALEVQEPDRARLRKVLAELEFRTLIERFSDDEGPEAPDGGEVDYRAITDPDQVEEVVRQAREAGGVAVDTETTSLSPMEARLVGISLSWEPGQGVYLPLAHEAPPADLLDDPGRAEAPPNLPPLSDPRMAPLRELLEDDEVPKSGQNLKYDLLVLRNAGVELGGIEFDTMVASYVLDPGRRSHGLDALSTDLLGYVPISYEDVAGKGRKQIPFARVPLEEAVPYACEDADLVLRLRAHLEPRLEEDGLMELFQTLEQPLIRVLARMEENGIRIDPKVFREMAGRLVSELDAIREEIWKEAGGEFNVNSTPQLREVLFERLELPVIKRTKTGPSTDASVLEELAADGHTLPARLLEYRQLEKLRSTYVEALPKLVNAGTGRIHASFNQTVAATGRLSSSDPNLQNIPIRTALGREVRRGFVPEEGALFLAADYSQIELRILAHVSGDEAFVTAFREDRDVHRQTAAVIFDVEVDEVTPEQRARAKTINFATLYGQGAFSLGRDLGLTREEAQGFIDRYFERFSGVRRFLDEQVALATEKGWVETLSGRRRQVPELESRNWNVRQFGERIAQNTPIQGTAADLIKRAMLTIHDQMEGVAPGARMLVQVHDELVFEAPEDELDALEAFVVETMESAMELDVPLKVDTGRGRSWYECK